MILAPESDMDALLTTEGAAEAAHVAPHVIRTWRTRGYNDATGTRVTLPVAGYDRRRRPLHRHLDVLVAEAATRNSGRSFRRCPPPSGADWPALDVKAA